MDFKDGKTVFNAPSRNWRKILLLSLLSLAFTCGWFLTQSSIPSNSKVGDSSPSESFESLDWRDATDTIFPFRPPQPWDISTDFQFPVKKEYEVTKGTWLRLDVHPRSGEIVFDMLGDIYCLPGHASKSPNPDPIRAHPILLGAPWDSDPHFSPTGDRLVFRSDAELGYENIWVMRWTSCRDMALRSSEDSPPPIRPELGYALQFQDADENMLASGIQETDERKARRLLREGRQAAHRVTNETYHWVSDARFHPWGKTVIATKWYTSARSLGAGEGWSYFVPSAADLAAGPGKVRKVKAGDGHRLIGRDLPFGWTRQDYASQQVGPEQFIWRSEDSLIYAENVVDINRGVFEYSKDIHKGIYAIFSTNLTTGVTEALASAFTGGASRPELSRDKRTLAFVKRVRDKEALVLKDLVTGTVRYIWYGLTYDLTMISAPMGTYPSFAFTPKDDAIIIWSSGSIWRVPLKLNAQGERISGGDPTIIPFIAKIEKRIANTLRPSTDLLSLETADTQRIYAFKELKVDDRGTNVVFQAAGVTYVQPVQINNKEEQQQQFLKAAQKVTVLYPDASYYSPSFVPHRSELVIHARWSESNFSSFELADISCSEAYDIVGLPTGRYFSPVMCRCRGQTRKIAFVKLEGDYLTGNIVATAQPGIYIGDIQIPAPNLGKPSNIGELSITNLEFIPSEIHLGDSVMNLQFIEGARKLLVQQSERSLIIDLTSCDRLGFYRHFTVARGMMSSEVSASPAEADYLAFVETFHVYLASREDVRHRPLWAKPGNATIGVARLSLDGGHDLAWSGDGRRLFWLLGPYLHSLDVSIINQCGSAIKRDTSTFGIQCTKTLLDVQEIEVSYETDIKRLKTDAAETLPPPSPDHPDGIPHAENVDVVVITAATLVTMETGKELLDVIPGGMLIIRGGVIEYANITNTSAIPPGPIKIIDAQGAVVVPGFIDVHAHWAGFSSTPIPAASWEQETFLAYGVTTVHNPSSGNRDGFIERARVESGKMIGSRIYHTGAIIYGAGIPDVHAEIQDMSEAYEALIRIKAEGGPASFSYKNYNLPSRAARQRLLLAARDAELSMICVPEGGMNYDWDLTYIADGMTTVEHAIPVPVLYDDVLTFYAESGTGSTPTHLVNYGGVMGEQYVWAHNDLQNNEKLRRFTRHDVLESIDETTMRPVDSYALFNTSESVYKLVQKGLHANIGAHGEPPLGFNYHAEMLFASKGGMSPYEVLRAATRSGAISLGVFSSLGSLTPGKLADFVIFSTAKVLEDISVSRDIRYVARGGRIWDATTMVEFWPKNGRKQEMPPFNPD